MTFLRVPLFLVQVKTNLPGNEILTRFNQRNRNMPSMGIPSYKNNVNERVGTGFNYISYTMITSFHGAIKHTN